MTYIIVLFLLLTAEIIYFRIADRFNIVDKPNERSSHKQVTLRGGGIIIWFAALLYAVFNQSDMGWWFLGGISLISIVSFWDDVKGLGQSIRMIFQIFVVIYLFIWLKIFGTYPWWGVLLGFLFIIAIINAYNFMDGINGITGLYTLAVLLPLMYVNHFVANFVNQDFIIFLLLASLVFLFFNCRKKARCFAGDVGSTGAAFWVIVLLLMLILKTQELIWVGFLIVYGVDTALTILHRIYLKQNILQAHRLHFYQILANEKRVSHLTVSALYFGVQLLSSALIIWLYPTWGWWVIVFILTTLSSLYLLKFKWIKQYNSK